MARPVARPVRGGRRSRNISVHQVRTSLDIVGTQYARHAMVGRKAEVKALGTVLDQVGFGRSAILLLEGEAGIGKTTLLEHALDIAQQRGMQVVSGHAEELERNRPFGLLTTAFGCRASAPDPRRAAIATMMVAPGSWSPQPSP